MKYLLLGILFLSPSLFYAQQNINIKKKAPSIHITDWVRNKPNETDLQGKFIVLEFWATWCSSCIAAVPHLNELQSQINDENIYFISITDEPRKKINHVISKINFQSMVVSDTTQQTQMAYGTGNSGLTAYPMTVLIDDDGIIQWIGEPKQLTIDILKDFKAKTLKGTHHLKSKQTVSTAITQEDFLSHRYHQIKKDTQTLFTFEFVELKHTSPSNASSINADNGFFVGSKNISGIYQFLFDTRITLEHPSMNKNEYSILYKNTHQKWKENLSFIEQTILNNLGFKKEIQGKRVFRNMVKIKDKSLLQITKKPLFSAVSEEGNSLIFTNYTIPKMLKKLSLSLKAEFVFSGRNPTKYDFIINSKDIDSAKASLASYGLSVVKKQKIIQQVHLKKK